MNWNPEELKKIVFYSMSPFCIFLDSLCHFSVTVKGFGFNECD